jgi:voltage-gated potassium channel
MLPSTPGNQEHDHRSWRERWYEIIFEADTPAGKLFDVVLLVAILLSVLVVMCESVDTIRAEFSEELFVAEWFFTILFTVEYVVRIACTRRPWAYIFSFYGIVDVLAILPTYIALPLAPGGSSAHRLAVIRTLRLLRAFRIFKLAHMLSEAAALRAAVWAARAKIAVFLSFVLIAIVIVGAAMHLIEGGRVDENDQPIATGFDSIWCLHVLVPGYGCGALPGGSFPYRSASKGDRGRQVPWECLHRRDYWMEVSEERQDHYSEQRIRLHHS